MLDLPGIPLQPQPPRPDLPGTVVARESFDDVLDAAAADLFVHAKNCVRAFGDFHLAVSVTDETEALLRRLMYDPNMRDLPWKRTHLWLTDERAAHPADDRSRFSVLQQLVVDQTDLPAEQTHPMLPLEPAADRHYESLLREHLGWREKGHDRLDFILLGLGADGGIAGLYPGGVAPASRDRLTQLNTPSPHEDRSVVTLTIEMINAARLIMVLAKGTSRREAITRLAEMKNRRPADQGTDMASSGPARPPVAALAPLAGELRWYLDRDAAPAAATGPLAP